jgi:hypothetical protein
MSPQKACEEILDRIVEINGGLNKVDFNVKMIAMNLNGESGVASIASEGASPPYAAFMNKNGFKLCSGKFMKEAGND